MANEETKAAGTGADPSETTAQDFIQKLRKALSRDGDFPASAKTVTELKMLVSDPKTTGDQITELILKEPSLGTRILHLVNSSFYRRAKPIMTISQAVVQIGMKPLAELCAGLVLLQRFVPAARRGGPFANALRQLILTSLLASSITQQLGKGRSKKNEETGYLAGSFAEMGVMLLAFYFPQVYDAALRRSEGKKQSISESLKQITGLDAIDLSIEVVKALELPDYYIQVLQAAQKISQNPITDESPLPPEVCSAANSVFAAHNISYTVVNSSNKQDLEKVLAEVQEKVKIEPAAMSKVLGDLPGLFKHHCASIELNLPALPEYVTNYEKSSESDAPAETGPASFEQDQFAHFVNEIKQAVENREPTASILTSVMETFAWCFNFDRVLLMLVNQNKTKLVGRMLLGKIDNFNPTNFARPISNEANPKAPDARAFKEGRAIFSGEPLFEGGWPIAAIPVGFGQRAIGIVYAERSGTDTAELDMHQQAAIGMLAELLDRSVALHS